LVLLIVWLVLQIGIPFFRKFGTFPFTYRYATYSWAMFSKPRVHYEVSLFRRNSNGDKETIPDVAQFTSEYHSAKTRASDYYRTPAEIKDRFTHLVNYIAEREDPNFEYGVSIHWVTLFDPNEPAQWEYYANRLQK